MTSLSPAGGGKGKGFSPKDKILLVKLHLEDDCENSFIYHHNFGRSGVDRL